MYTKSDSHIAKWPDRTFRKDSPPRVPPPNHPPEHEQRPTHHLYSHNSDPSKQKKHISFNTFVEQCIAIEKPTPKRRGSSTHFVPTVNEGSVHHPCDLEQAYTNVPTSSDRYDDDSETGDDDDSDEPSYRYMNKAGGMDTDSEDDDDDDEEVLEMRSRSSSSSSSRPSLHRSRQSARARARRSRRTRSRTRTARARRRTAAP